jgi:hypothetical protein
MTVEKRSDPSLNCYGTQLTAQVWHAFVPAEADRSKLRAGSAPFVNAITQPVGSLRQQRRRGSTHVKQTMLRYKEAVSYERGKELSYGNARLVPVPGCGKTS